METQVYVLIRTKCQFCFTWLFKRRYRFFKQAIESVLRQDHSNIRIVILQDSWWRLSGRPHLGRLPDFCRDIIPATADVMFYTCNSRGAAHSLYNIREVLFGLSSNDEDVAVMLDDDDIFAYSGAVSAIVQKMSAGADVCVTQFENIGQSSMSIVNRGGDRHNRLVAQGVLTPDMKAPFGPGSLCFADSLGWTKSYRVKVLKEYHNDLYDCFGSYRKLNRFLRKNDAFEDFPDIINLCRKGVSVVGLDIPTHAYRKHAGSITSSPRKSDFVHKRPNYLALLVRLYRQLKGQDRLAPGTDMVIARYCVVKTLTIENILAKFRSDENYVWSLRNFRRGDFVRRILQVFSKYGLLDDFIEILHNANDLEIDNGNKDVYEEIKKKAGNADSPFMVFCRVCHNEVCNGGVDVSKVMCERPTRRRMDVRTMARYKYIAIFIAYVGLLPCAIAFASRSEADWEAIIALVVPFAGWIYAVYTREKRKMQMREISMDRFCESVDELQRHLCANLNVLINIKYALDRDKSFRPAKVHFTNLKVLSHLSSTEWDDSIIVDKFANLHNLRVCIRNIDNSAVYMEEYVGKASYDGAEMKKIVEWEIVRYIGYIIRFRFFTKDKSFMLLNTEQIKIYVRFNDVLDDLVKGIKVGDKERPKVRGDIESYYNRFITDREVQREVLSVLL